MTIPRTLGAAHGRRMKHVHVYTYIHIRVLVSNLRCHELLSYAS